MKKEPFILKALYEQLNDFQDETLCTAANPETSTKGYQELLDEHFLIIKEIISRWQLKILKSVVTDDYDQEDK